MSDQSERVALLPCPFCGGDAAFERLGSPRQSCIVSCNNCGCRLEANENWDFGAAWNTRADAALAEIGAVREMALLSIGEALQELASSPIGVIPMCAEKYYDGNRGVFTAERIARAIAEGKG